MTTILHLAALAGVCLGLTLFLLLAVSAHVVRQVDQELADEAAGTPYGLRPMNGADSDTYPLAW